MNLRGFLKHEDDRTHCITAQWSSHSHRMQILRRKCGALRKTAMGHSRLSRRSYVPFDVRFSNRPFEVKHFQTIRRYSVDVAHGLALLFGIGTSGPSIMGFEDEVEQSLTRPCL